MQKRTNNLIAGIILIICGFAYLLEITGIININSNLILSYAAVIYGLSTVYLYMGSRSNGIIFRGSIIFMAGILLMTINYFSFPDVKSIIIPSFMFITGSGFFMLYLNSTANRIFLYSSGTLFAFTIIYVWAARNYAFVMLADNFSQILFEYYPLVIILIGIVMLYGRKKLY